MKVRTALLELFRESQEFRAFFRSCCDHSALRLRTQSWQFHDKLEGRGHKFRRAEVQDALLGLARELLPETPAAEWDAEWAHELCKVALTRLAKRYAELAVAEKDALDFSTQDPWDEQLRAATLGNDPSAFRVVLNGWEQAGLDAIQSVQQRGGAA